MTHKKLPANKLSDAEKLRALARWFNVYDAKNNVVELPGGTPVAKSTEVQDDLNRIADKLEKTT